MARKREIGICEHCGKEFGYYLVHNGFGDCAYAYCDRCPYSVYLSTLSNNPSNISLPIGGKIPEDVERFMKPCPCGGSFRSSALPRCPHCLSSISPVFAASYIEKNAANGWRWRQSWDDGYSIVIENLYVDEWWKGEESTSR